MSDVTRILSAIERGDPSAAEQLLPLVYEELRRLAETDLPLSAVAQKAGFRHREYMGVVFRKLVGKTPGQFRKETHPIMEDPARKSLEVAG